MKGIPTALLVAIGLLGATWFDRAEAYDRWLPSNSRACLIVCGNARSYAAVIGLHGNDWTYVCMEMTGLMSAQEYPVARQHLGEATMLEHLPVAQFQADRVASTRRTLSASASTDP
jgi:hypothetical protein